jgi:hypothetical protein
LKTYQTDPLSILAITRVLFHSLALSRGAASVEQDPRRQKRPRLLPVGVRMARVPKDAATASDHVGIVAHVSISFSRSGTPSLDLD